MLIEAAWSYRFPARISREQLLRQEQLPKTIRDTAWKAQVRLCSRYRKLTKAGKPKSSSSRRRRADQKAMCTWARLGARSRQETPRFHYQPDSFRRCHLTVSG
jgi:hypothetical protein